MSEESLLTTEIKAMVGEEAELPELFKGEDPRGNREIIESLKQAGKLR